MIERGLFFFIGEKGASANYVHVDDVVEALVLCGTHKSARGKTFNISDFCTMEDFVKMISSELAINAPSIRLPILLVKFLAIVVAFIPKVHLTQARVDALINRSVYGVGSIKSELNYIYKVGIKKGVKDLVAEYKRIK